MSFPYNRFHGNAIIVSIISVMAQVMYLVNFRKSCRCTAERTNISASAVAQLGMLRRRRAM